MLIQFGVRLRQDKIDFKNSWVIAILAVVATGFAIIPGMRDDSIFEIILAFTLIGILISIFAFLASSVAESVSREVWNEKLYSYDRLFQGKIFSPKLGISLLNGLAFAGIILGVIAVLISIADVIENLSLDYENSQVINFMFHFPFFLNI